MDDALVARGILYAPDFVVNAGGILNIAEEFTGYSPRAGAGVDGPHRGDDGAGVRRARASGGSRPGGRPSGWRASASRPRRCPAGGGRPGDPAAWTDGQPLTRLRP